MLILLLLALLLQIKSGLIFNTSGKNITLQRNKRAISYRTLQRYLRKNLNIKLRLRQDDSFGYSFNYKSIFVPGRLKTRNNLFWYTCLSHEIGHHIHLTNSRLSSFFNFCCNAFTTKIPVIVIAYWIFHSFGLNLHNILYLIIFLGVIIISFFVLLAEFFASYIGYKTMKKVFLMTKVERRAILKIYFFAYMSYFFTTIMFLICMMK